MAKDWISVQEEIRSLYHVENKPLSEVIRLIRGRHGFIASERAYRTQLRKWGYMKNSTQAFPKPTRASRSVQITGISSVNITPTSQSATSSLATFSPFETTGNDMYLETRNPQLSNQTNGHYMDFGHDINGTIPFAFVANEPDHEGKTQLHRAVINKDVAQAKTLLFGGASINAKDQLDNQPLHYGVIAGEIEMIKLLLQYGADVNAKGQLGRTPLHLALPSKNAVHTLLREDADVSSQDEKGDTPLHLAVSLCADGESNHCAMLQGVCETLLQAASDPNQENRIGVSPLLKLLDQPQTPTTLDHILLLMNKGGSIAKCMPDGRTPFQVFLSYVNTSWADSGRRFWNQPKENRILHLFIAQGASVMTLMPNRKPFAMTFIAERYCDWGTDKKLAELICKSVKASEMGVLATNGNSLLHQLSAAYLRKPAEVVLLMRTILRNGADTDHRNNDGNTPLLLLFSAPKTVSPSIEGAVAALLSHGSNPWIQDSRGECAVSKAARKASKDCPIILKIMLEGDMRHWESENETYAPVFEGSRQHRWLAWEQALRADNWKEAKSKIEEDNNLFWEDIRDTLHKSACGVLAERFLQRAKGQTQRHDFDLDSHRRHVASILRDCRISDIPIDMRYFDHLLDLCS